MALILCIETATEVCSVALLQDGKLIALKESQGSNEHSSQLTLFIDEVRKSSGKLFSDLDAIAVSVGPGSYTGLRIGVSAAKGLCYALEKPLISISTLKGLALSALNTYGETLKPNTVLCPMIDARRMEVYTALFDQKLNEISPVNALIVEKDTWFLYDDMQLAIFGSGAGKCKDLYINHLNIHFPGIVFPSAKSIGHLAEEKFNKKEFENIAYFEPLYLKDFIAGLPKVKGLRS
jgi:tRNA threonylcarbamoyladenosine biosynthesis protein TsaB